MAERLRPDDRIRRGAEYQKIYRDGARCRGRLMTVFVLASDREGPRLGVTATRKLGSAAQRNRAKRLAREVFRRNKPAAGYDIVVVPRPEMLSAGFSDVEADYCSVLRRRVRH
jgi:ribonuclease P protein component